MGRRSASRKWLLLLLTAAALALVACADQSDSSGVSQPEWRSWKTRRRSESRDGGGEHRRPRHRAHKEPTTVREEEPQEDESGVEKCEVARLKCAYRVGCGMALQNYMVGCADVMSGASQRCSDHCRNALIALTSTEEGQALMKCKCGDSFCRDTKRRIDICRTAVLRATHNSTTVSCSVAQWICMADPLCSTALDYYHQYCRSMFTGKKCTHRCNNSISILRRQEKAAKLSTCVCDGSEDYDCQSIRDNMDRLCFHKTPSTTPKSGADQGQGWTSTASAQPGVERERAGPDTTPRPIRTTRGLAPTTPPRPTSNPTRSKYDTGTRPPVTGQAEDPAGSSRHVIARPDSECWSCSRPPSRCCPHGGGSGETPPTRPTHIPRRTVRSFLKTFEKTPTLSVTGGCGKTFERDPTRPPESDVPQTTTPGLFFFLAPLHSKPPPEEDCETGRSLPTHIPARLTIKTSSSSSGDCLAQSPRSNLSPRGHEHLND